MHSRREVYSHTGKRGKSVKLDLKIRLARDRFFFNLVTGFFMLSFRPYCLAGVLVWALGVGCLREESNQLGLGEWRGVSLETGEEVRFRDLPYEVLALNVYGLNCPPCWKEIPALNRIGEKLSADPRFALFLIVDPILILESSQEGRKNSQLSSEDWKRVVEIMNREKQLRNIQVPIYLMKPPFRVSPDSFVTGTPETILVRTRPWNLYYNFIGSLSEKQDVASIDADPKVRFLMAKMGARQ